MIVVLVWLACTNPNPPLADGEAARKPLQCVVVAAEAKEVSEDSAKAFSKWCEASSFCVERRTGIYLLHAVAPQVVERKI